MHGLGKLRSPGIVAQRSAQVRDTGRRPGVANRDSRPNRIEQHRPGHELIGTLNQIAQHVEGLAPWTYLFLASPELLVHVMRAKRREKAMVRLAGHGRVLARRYIPSILALC